MAARPPVTATSVDLTAQHTEEIRHALNLVENH